MSWPLSQDYNEAIQSPGSNFSDADLQKGEAVTNPLGIPLPRSGNFADVYELRCPGGDRWAVKCFTREVPGLRERYAAISRHLTQTQLPFIVDFTFLEQGIRACGRWYPILKMQWVEGLTLNEFVRQYADKPAMLKNLLQIWVRMAARLRECGIAHADLQHGNVLLVPGSTANSLAVKLVDYDGMFVPALAGGDSGEVGHPCYQHPQRSAERTYSLEVDRFPLLLVATALDGLRVGGQALWEKYDSGDNLLFREADLRAPVKSPLFYELLKLGDERAPRLARQTLDALKGRLESVPLLEEVLPELHAAPVPKPTTPRRTNVQMVAVQHAAGTTEAGSAWDFEGDDNKPRSRQRRKGGVPRWVWAAAGAGMAALVLAGGIFAWALRNETEKPSDKGPIAKIKPEKPAQHPGKSPAKTASQVEEPDANQLQKQDPDPLVPVPTSPPEPPKPQNPPMKPSPEPPTPPDPVVQKPPKEPGEEPAEPVVPKPTAKPPEKPDEPVVENPPTKPADSKQEMPSDEAVEAAVKDVHNAFQEDYARQTSKARQELAAKLLDEGRRSKDDPVRRFALYREARDLAARGAAPALSLEAAEEMAKAYPLDPVEAKVAALKLAGKTADTPDSAKDYLKTALSLLKDAQEADQYDAITPLVLPTRLALRYVRDAEKKRTAESLLAQMEYLRKQYDPVKAAVQTLKEKPDDPRANLAVGRFLCFHKKNWEKGLPLLGKGSDKALADAAEKDLAQPGQAAEQMALGDAWYDLAKTQADVRPTLHRRACEWYVSAILELSGADKTRVEKRVVEISKSSPEMRAAWSDLDIKEAVAVGDAYLRLPLGRLLAIKKPLGGQVEIAVVCRQARQVPHFEVLQDRDAFAFWEHKDGILWFKRPRGNGSGFRVEFTPDRWETFTCRVTDSGLHGAFGKQSVFLNDRTPANLTKPRTFLIRAVDEKLEVRSFTVKPIGP